MTKYPTILATKADGTSELLSREDFIARESEFKNHYDVEVGEATPQIKFNDYNFDDVAEQMSNAMKNGADVYQKWTCSNCGSRQTMEQKNKLYTSGKCEECGTVTQITKCNWMAHFHKDGGIEIG